METKASYIGVGAFMVALMTLLAGFALWLGASAVGDDADRYRIYFGGSVTGLQVGSPVRYQGVPVGTVGSIALATDRPGEVAVTIAVERGTPIQDNTVASMQMQGVTGGVFVQLEPGAAQGEAVRVPPGGDLPVIPSKASPIQSVLDSLPAVLNQVTTLLNQASGFLGEETQQAVLETLINTQTLTETLSDNAESFTAAVDNVNILIANANSLLTDLQGSQEALVGQAIETLAAMEGTATAAERTVTRLEPEMASLTASLSGTAAQLETLVTEVQPGVSDFANFGLYEFTLMVAEVRDLTENLNRVARRLEREPAQVLFGGGGGVSAEGAR